MLAITSAGGGSGAPMQPAWYFVIGLPVQHLVIIKCESANNAKAAIKFGKKV